MAITATYDVFLSHASPDKPAVEKLARRLKRQAEPGSGLHLRVHPGRAIAGGTLRYHSAPTNLLLPPHATTCLWQRASGAWELTASTDPPPETTAFGPLWIATTDANSVTELLDRRTLAADTIVLHLRGNLPATPGVIAETLVVHDGMALEEVVYRLSGNGGGSAGQTQLDLLLDGATLYPSFALDDQRASWSFDTVDFIQHDHVHEVAELHPGQLIQLAIIGYPTGGTPVRAEAYLICRRL